MGASRHGRLLFSTRRLEAGGHRVRRCGGDECDQAVFIREQAREYLDWDTLNKLAAMNGDFSEFLKRVKTDFTSREIRREKDDKVFDLEELRKLIKGEN